MIAEIWRPLIDNERCTACGDCVAACPSDALQLARNTAVLAEPAACNYCGQCEAICPVEAIALPYQIVSAPAD